MRRYLIPLIFGLLGVILFLGAVSFDGFPDALASLNLPGLMVAFAFIHGSEGAVGWLALAAGAAVQFVLFAVTGMLGAAACRAIFPSHSRRGQQAAGDR